MRSHFLLAAFFICLNLHAQDKASASADTISAHSAIDMRLYHASENDKALFATEVNKQMLQQNNELSLFELLQGKISGLDIISASGGSARNVTALMRGNLNSQSTPLVVIDGIPQRFVSNITLINTNEDLQNLLPVSIGDILSIEILKNDPSALLYGADGANGVIYIETKKGMVHKPVFTYQFNQSLLPEPVFNKMLNGDEYIMYQLEALHNKYGVFEIPSEIAYDRDYAGFYNYSQNTDWVKAVTQPAHASNHFLNVSGGNKKNLYYGSLNYNNRKGSIINSGFEQFFNRWHFEHYFSKKFTVGANLNYAYYDINDNVTIDGRDILEMAYIKAPNMSIWEYDSQGRKTGEYFNPINSYQGNGSTYFNPVAVAELAERNGRENLLQSNLTLNYNIKSWLTFRETLSFRFKRLKEKNYLPYNAIGTDWLEWKINAAEESKTQETSINTESQLTIEAPFKSSNHQLTGAVTWITKSGAGDWMSFQSNKIAGTDINDPSINGQINWIDEGSWELRGTGAVINLNYKLKDRYLITGILRSDSYSSFENHRRSLLKGLSAGWRFSEEPWFNDAEFLDNGLIMGGLSSSEYYPIDIPYIYPSVKIRNKPSFNLGIQLGLLNRVNFEGTFYGRKRESDNSFYGVLKSQNTGWEAGIEYDAIKEKDLTWFLYFNLAHDNCNITDAPDDINYLHAAKLTIGYLATYISENTPPGSIYGLHYDGVYATDQDAFARDENGNIIYNDGVPVAITYNTYAFKGGDAKYRDVNYDGVIDESDVSYLGNSAPKFTGGFGSTLQYKNFSLNFNFHFRLGQKIILQEALITDGLFTKNNHSKRILNRWRMPGDQRPGMLPRAYLDHPANYLGSDLYVESGSYVRMNHISLEYRVKQEWCRKFHLSELSLILSSQRLFTFTHSNALDPETTSRDDIRLYPPKVYTFSIRLGI